MFLIAPKNSAPCEARAERTQGSAGREWQIAYVEMPGTDAEEALLKLG